MGFHYHHGGKYQVVLREGYDPPSTAYQAAALPIVLTEHAGGVSIRYGFESLAIPSHEETSVDPRGIEPLTSPCHGDVFPTILRALGAGTWMNTRITRQKWR